jgi:hypothetical protein
MNEPGQTIDEYLSAIGASCHRLLYALQESPEAVWGELMKMESSCHAFEEASAGFKDHLAAAREMGALVEALRVQMARDGLIDYQELAAFRQGVSAVRRCADRIRDALGEADARSHPA